MYFFPVAKFQWKQKKHQSSFQTRICMASFPFLDTEEWGMSPMMQRYMKSQTTSGAQDSAFAIGSRNQAILEINPDHSVIKADVANEKMRNMVM